MNSSGIRRGLAVAATSALALAGLAFAPANAQTIDITQDDPATAGATLYTPFGAAQSISTKVDGNGNTTVTLLATAGKTYGGQTVNTIHLWTPANTGWLDVHVPVVAGVASYQWTPPANVGVVAVNARAEAAGNLAIGTTDSHSVDTTNPNANQSISINGANRDKMGLFYNPTANTWTGSVTGKTGTAAAPGVRVAGPGTPTVGTTVITSAPDSNGLRGYQSTIALPGVTGNGNLHDVTQFANGTETDDLVVQAATGQDFDGRVFSGYKQIIPAGGATAAVRAGSTANVFGSVADSYNADDLIQNNDRTFYNIKVVDQFGSPVTGVPVYESTVSGATLDAAGKIIDPTNPNLSDTATGITGADGAVQVRLDEGTIDLAGDQDPTPGVQATYYVVDVNGDGAFQNGTDYVLKVSQTNIAAAPAHVDVTGALGTAMDDDETNPLKVKVTDADNNPIPNTAVTATIKITDATTGQQVSAVAQVGNTNASGEFALSLTPPDDQHVIVTIDAATNNNIHGSLTVEADRSFVQWNPQHYQALVGGQIEAKGVLQLPSGKLLKGRSIALNLTPGTGAPADARFPTTGQPAGTVAGTPTTATATTGDGGAFSIILKDGATTGQELNDLITATSPGLEIPTDYPVGYPTNVAQVDFLRSVTPDHVELYRNNAVGSPTNNGLTPVKGGVANSPMPGGLGRGGVSVYNSDNIALVNLSVPLTINEGFFVDPADPYDPAPVVGGLAGEFKSAGKTFNVNTGNGVGTYYVDIERNTGFDDDGIVQDKVHAAIASATAERDFEWTTNTVPLNNGSFAVTLSDAQQSSILPKARAGTGNSAQFVDYDVTTTDQFGNPTSQSLSVDDNTPVASFFDSVDGDLNSEMGLTQPAITAFSPSAASQALEVELNGNVKNVFVDNPLNSTFTPAMFIGNPFIATAQSTVQKQVTTDPIDWYTVDLNDPSLYTLTQEGSENVPVGSTVSYTLTAIDPEGQPINGSGVGFLRVGPGDQGQDDDGQVSDLTNADGEAFYDFAGSVPGTASVSAVVYDDNPSGATPGVYNRLFVVGPDTVKFGQVVNHINPKLSGSNTATGKDVLTVNAKKAYGATVKLFKFTGSGKVLVKTSHLDGNGQKVFKVKDKNGNKKTKYIAKVLSTPRTAKATTNSVNLK